MDLAIEFGMPTERLARELPNREFRSWAKYAATRMLPTRRVEIYLAQIAWVVARAVGGNDSAKLDDFLIDFGGGEEAEGEPDLDAAIDAFQFNPTNKKAKE